MFDNMMHQFVTIYRTVEYEFPFSSALKWTPESEERKNNDSMGDQNSDGGDDDSHRSGEFEFVPTCWLVNWLAIPEVVGPLETCHLLCVHRRLDIDRIADFKICDAATVGRLVREHGAGEGPRLDKVSNVPRYWNISAFRSQAPPPVLVFNILER